MTAAYQTIDTESSTGVFELSSMWLRLYTFVREWGMSHMGIDVSSVLGLLAFAWTARRFLPEVGARIYEPLIQMFGLVQDHFMTTKVIRHRELLHTLCKDWLSEEFVKKERRCTEAKFVYSTVFDETEEDDESPGRKIGYSLPIDTTFWLLHKRRWFRASYTTVSTVGDRSEVQDGQTQRPKGDLWISCWGRRGGEAPAMVISIPTDRTEPIKELLADMMKERKEVLSRHVTVWRVYHEGWYVFRNVRRRPMETVIMRKSVKEALLKDATEFLSRESIDDHKRLAVPFRRGYWLSGPPGSGKTTLSVALATHLGQHIYKLNLNDLEQGKLPNILNSLPGRCVVLVDEFDPKNLRAIKRGDQEREVQERGVTLEGLLEAMDGADSHEGHIIIFITRDTVKLDDPALTRPGRIDVKVELGKCGKHMIGEMLQWMYRDVGNLEDLIPLLTSKIPENTVTPAQLKDFLWKHRREPEEVPKRLVAWTNSGYQHLGPLGVIRASAPRTD